MKASKHLIEKIKEFEGFVMRAYKPKGERGTKGLLTIGYGHLGAREGELITKNQAEELLRKDIEEVERQLLTLPLPPLKQGQWDAIVDFCFNLGVHSFRTSTLYRKIIQERPTSEIVAQFNRWIYSGKTKLPGLVRRRAWEAEMWAK